MVTVAVLKDDVAGPGKIAFVKLDEVVDIRNAGPVVIVDLVLVVEEAVELETPDFAYLLAHVVVAERLGRVVVTGDEGAVVGQGGLDSHIHVVPAHLERIAIA